MKFFKHIFSISILTAFFAVAAFAQQPGSLRGQVVDTLGAVIVGANVTVVAADGKEKTTVSNNAGAYSPASVSAAPSSGDAPPVTSVTPGER